MDLIIFAAGFAVGCGLTGLAMLAVMKGGLIQVHVETPRQEADRTPPAQGFDAPPPPYLELPVDEDKEQQEVDRMRRHIEELAGSEEPRVW